MNQIVNISQAIAYIASIGGKIEFRQDDSERLQFVEITIDEDPPKAIEQCMSIDMMTAFRGSSLLDREIVRMVKELEEANRGEPAGRD